MNEQREGTFIAMLRSSSCPSTTPLGVTRDPLRCSVPFLRVTRLALDRKLPYRSDDIPRSSATLAWSTSTLRRMSSPALDQPEISVQLPIHSAYQPHHQHKHQHEHRRLCCTSVPHPLASHADRLRHTDGACVLTSLSALSADVSCYRTRD
jgi:hypothetical protein